MSSTAELVVCTERWIRERVEISVNQLHNVRSLMLPGSHVEKITHLGGSLQNFIRLKNLDLSCNALESLEGLEHLQMLTRLNLYFNKLPELTELFRLRHNKQLVELDLRLNPVSTKNPEYRMCLIHLLPNLKVLDDMSISASQRAAAVSYFTTDQVEKFDREDRARAQQIASTINSTIKSRNKSKINPRTNLNSHKNENTSHCDMRRGDTSHCDMRRGVSRGATAKTRNKRVGFDELKSCDSGGVDLSSELLDELLKNNDYRHSSTGSCNSLQGSDDKSGAVHGDSTELRPTGCPEGKQGFWGGWQTTVGIETDELPGTEIKEPDMRYGPASSGRFGHKQKSSRAQLPSLAEKLPDHGSSDEKSEFLSLPVRSPGDNASRVSGGDHTSVRGWERRHTVPEHELNITMSPPAAASLPSPSEVAFNDMVPKTVAALVPLIEEFYRPGYPLGFQFQAQVRGLLERKLVRPIVDGFRTSEAVLQADLTAGVTMLKTAEASITAGNSRQIELLEQITAIFNTNGMEDLAKEAGHVDMARCAEDRHARLLSIIKRGIESLTSKMTESDRKRIQAEAEALRATNTEAKHLEKIKSLQEEVQTEGLVSANAELRDQLAAAEAKQAKMEAELTSVRETHGTDGESIQQLKDLCALLQESQRSIAATNEHLLQQLQDERQHFEDERSKHAKELKQLRWNYSELKRTADLLAV